MGGESRENHRRRRPRRQFPIEKQNVRKTSLTTERRTGMYIELATVLIMIVVCLVLLLYLCPLPTPPAPWNVPDRLGVASPMWWRSPGSDYLIGLSPVESDGSGPLVLLDAGARTPDPTSESIPGLLPTAHLRMETRQTQNDLVVTRVDARLPTFVVSAGQGPSRILTSAGINFTLVAIRIDRACTHVGREGPRNRVAEVQLVHRETQTTTPGNMLVVVCPLVQGGPGAFDSLLVESTTESTLTVALEALPVEILGTPTVFTEECLRGCITWVVSQCVVETST
jgi:hypothetical protein